MQRFFCLLFILICFCFLSTEFKWLYWWPYKLSVHGSLSPCIKEIGFAYDCRFQFNESIPFTHFIPNDNEVKIQSNLKISSTHFKWSQSHQIHDSIRQKGDGLYSHWKDHVLLSTPQNSSIESFGIIHIESPLRLKTPFMLFITLLLILLVHYFLFLNKSLISTIGIFLNQRYPRFISKLKKVFCNS